MVPSTSTTLMLLPVIVVVLIQCSIEVVDCSFVSQPQQHRYRRYLPTSSHSDYHRERARHQHQHQHRHRRHNHHQSQITIMSNLKENANTDNVCHESREREGEEALALQFPNLSIIGICGSIGSGKSYTCSLLVSKLNSLLSSSSSSSLSPPPMSNGDDEIDDDDSYKTDKRQHNLQQQEEEDQIAFHIDTDSLAHGVYKPGSLALKEIEEEFGNGVIRGDGTVDRKVLGGIVFNDDAQMAKLEQIVWPHVKTILLERLNQIETAPSTTTKRRIVVVEAAVLLDANWDDNELFDAIWVVRSSSQVSAERLVSKRGMAREDALKRMEAQLSRRGIGNLDQELLNGYVTAVIQNDGDSTTSCIDTDSRGKKRNETGKEVETRGDGSELWNTIQECLTDPTSWKDGRCPKEVFEKLPDFNKT